MTITRTFDATAVNSVVNHPSVFPDVGRKGQVAGELDLSPVLADPRHVLLMAEHGNGGLLFIQHEPGVYEVHTQFVEGFRGASALGVVKEALEWMFTRSDAMELQSQVPQGNARALGLVRAIGGQLLFSRDSAWERADGGVVGVDYFGLHYNSWVRSASGLVLKGRWFHEELEKQKAKLNFTSAAHADDLAHDRAVGAAVAMIQGGQTGKALLLYNRWARFAGYLPVRVVNVEPLLLDIFECFLWIKPEGSFEVLPCKTPNALALASLAA